MTTSWIWQTEQGVNGLRIDRDSGVMRWYDAIGCGCGMESGAIEQTIADFQQSGLPAMFAPPPDDVLGEIDETIAELATNG